MDLLKYELHWGMPDIIKSVDSHEEATYSKFFTILQHTLYNFNIYHPNGSFKTWDALGNAWLNLLIPPTPHPRKPSILVLHYSSVHISYILLNIPKWDFFFLNEMHWGMPDIICWFYPVNLLVLPLFSTLYLNVWGVFLGGGFATQLWGIRDATSILIQGPATQSIFNKKQKTK